MSASLRHGSVANKMGIISNRLKPSSSAGASNTLEDSYQSRTSKTSR